MNSRFKPITLIAVSCLAFLWCARSAGQQPGDADRVARHKELGWAPPDVSAPLPSIAAVPPCSLSKVLEQAGTHAVELTSNLENFTAEEQIEYEMLDQTGYRVEGDSSTFDYVFAFERTGKGLASQEYRTPTKGGHSFRASNRDTGQVALALILHPNIRTDYDMSCEGTDKWNGWSAWVIHFEQRKDKPRRSLEFRNQQGGYPAMLKGRAWISAENGQLLHLETNLMQDISAMGLRKNAISLDYAPVQIQSRKLDLWLPQSVKSFSQFADHRIILFHTFTNFKIFSVDTEQSIQKPKNP